MSYAIWGSQRVREKQLLHLNICLGRLCMNFERAYQFTINVSVLDLPIHFQVPNAQEG